MKTQTKLMITLLSLIVFVGIAKAQTVEQVASELDNVEVDLVTVNSKADNAKAKSDANEAKTLGVEQRVTALEAKPDIDPTVEGRVLTLESGHSSHESRLLSLEAVPSYNDAPLAARVTALETNPGGVSQAAHDALSSRVTTLETAPDPTPLKWVIRDAQGTFVADAFDRAALGFHFFTVAGHEIRAEVTPSGIDWIGLRAVGSTIYWPNSQCGADGSAPVIRAGGHQPPDLSSGGFFGGIVQGRANTRPDGTKYVTKFDLSTVVPMTIYRWQSNGSCGFFVNGADVHQSVYQFELPFFVAPFTVAQE